MFSGFNAEVSSMGSTSNHENPSHIHPDTTMTLRIPHNANSQDPAAGDRRGNGKANHLFHNDEMVIQIDLP